MGESPPALDRPPVRCRWLYDLAAGYLVPFPHRRAHQRSPLSGYFFEAHQKKARAGFFIGFLTRARNKKSPPAWAWLELQPPECVVFAFVRPLRSRPHDRWVGATRSLFRQAYERLTKYTVRRPRFEFHEERLPAILRHVSLATFPAGERDKHARNFFTETLALLVRSGLPEALAHRDRRTRLPY